MAEQKESVLFFYVYQDKQGGWRWRLLSTGLRIIALASESYATKEECKAIVDLVRRAHDAIMLED